MAAPEQAIQPRTSRSRLVARNHQLRNGVAIVCGALLVMGVLIGMVSSLSPGAAGPRVAADSSIPVDPSSVEFGGQTDGTTSGIRTVVVANRDRTLAVSIRSVEISGADASDFILETNICKPASLRAGQSCSIGVRFAPRAAGSRQAVLLVHRGDVSRTLTVMLSGEGIAQPLSVQQSNVDFGYIAVNATSTSSTISATNTSSQLVVMAGVAVVGDHPQDFSIKSAAGCAGTTLTPGVSCVVSVTFTPTDVGSRTASLAYSYQGAGSPLFVGLTGVGATLSLLVTPIHVDFGKQQVGVAGSPTVMTMSTPAGTTVTIGSVTVTGPDAAYFKVTSDNCTGKSLTHTTSCTVAAQFIPGAIGVRLASLTFVRAHEVTVLNEVQFSGFGFVPRPPKLPPRDIR